MNYRFKYYKNKIKKFFNKDEEYIVWQG
jgi:hypothetical protein